MNRHFVSIVSLIFVIQGACTEQNTSTYTTRDVTTNENLAKYITPPPTPQDTAVDVKSIKVEIDGKQTELVPAAEIVPDLMEDLKYATTDNFMRRKLYDDPKCYLLKETVEKLLWADKELSLRKPGYRLKVWDCYRPMRIQQEMWKEYTNTPYVANPKSARHPRGRAVDITIADASGNDVEMPTKFDDFTPKAHPNAPTTPKAAANRELLRSVMTSAGFTGVNSEWWHFDNLTNSTGSKR